MDATEFFIHAGANVAVQSMSRQIIDSLLQLKNNVEDKLSDTEMITPVLRTDTGKLTLTERQRSNHLINLKVDILD